MHKNSVTLAILCGGQSRRLGTDKGLFQPLGDESLVARALRLWAPLFAETLVVVRDGAQAQLYQRALPRLTALCRVVQDSTTAATQGLSAPVIPPSAAISGLLTALTHASQPAVLAIPVDQLGVRSLHLRRLLAEGLNSSRPSAFTMPDSSPLPFPSLWPTGMTERLQARVLGGALSVRGALSDVGFTCIPAEHYLDELNINGNTQESLKNYFGEALFDAQGRRLHYLRFSLTEACNMACTYCLPKGFPEWYRHKARLSLDDIGTMLKGFRHLGFRKVRFTGGEPTVHPDCLGAIDLARRLGYESIALTTNGAKIDNLDSWIDHGLTELNVSLDSLDEQVFHAITGSHKVRQVQSLVEAAAAADLTVKVNTVLQRSLNGSPYHIESLMDWALSLPISLRFIELMNTKLNDSFAANERVLGPELEPFMTARGLTPIAMHPGAAPGQKLNLRGPAVEYGSPRWRGRIGLINPLSCNFCNNCNRLRVTAQGRLKLCLFGDHDEPMDLSSSHAVALNVRQLIGRKPERHGLESGKVGNVATFRTVGG